MSNLKVNTINDANGGNAAVLYGVASPPNSMGFRNRIINGDMRIDQRNAGASQTITSGVGTLAFNCDRWQVRSAGANATVQQIVTNNVYRMRFTGAASVSAVAAQQSIEALNCVDLAGGSVTISLLASSTSLTSLTLEAYYANSTNSFGTWGSPTVTTIATQAVNISTTESLVTWTFSVPSAATTGIQIRITGGALGAAQTLTIGNVQLEAGTVASPFERRDYGRELMMCQRYYCKTFNADVAPVQNGGTAGAIYFISQVANVIYDAMWRFPVEMRTTPSVITTFSPNAASANWLTNVDTPTASISISGSAGIAVRASTPTAASRAFGIHITASAEL